MKKIKYEKDIKYRMEQDMKEYIGEIIKKHEKKKLAII